MLTSRIAHLAMGINVCDIFLKHGETLSLFRKDTLVVIRSEITMRCTNGVGLGVMIYPKRQQAGIYQMKVMLSVWWLSIEQDPTKEQYD